MESNTWIIKFWFKSCVKQSRTLCAKRLSATYKTNRARRFPQAVSRPPQYKHGLCLKSAPYTKGQISKARKTALDYRDVSIAVHNFRDYMALLDEKTAAGDQRQL